jgi:hypothetical protein
VRKSFVNPILRDLNKNTRAKVEGQSGQLLLLDDVEALKTVVEASIGERVPAPVLAKALKIGQARAKGLQDGYRRSKAGARRYNNIVARAPSVLRSQHLVIGKNAFVVASFSSSIKKVKDVMVKSIFDDMGMAGDSRIPKASSRIERGHGVEGFAVSQVQLASAFNKASSVFGNTALLADNFSAFIGEAEISDNTKGFVHQIEQLSTNYHHMITKTGVLKAQYFSIVSFQDQGSNAEDGKMEKRLITLFRQFIDKKFAQQVVDLKGSPSIKDKIGAHIFHELTDNIKKQPNIRVRDDKPLKKGVKSKGKVVQYSKGQSSKATIRRKPKGQIKARKTAAAGSRSATKPLQLLGILNKSLPETVRGNMGEPGLVNRTGRFSESVRVTDISTTAQGFPSIGYTYMTEPYGVFEMGRGSPPWATADRDPRKVIDKSIREIAIQFAIGRFYTRRV